MVRRQACAASDDVDQCALATQVQDEAKGSEVEPHIDSAAWEVAAYGRVTLISD